MPVRKAAPSLPLIRFEPPEGLLGPIGPSPEGPPPPGSANPPLGAAPPRSVGRRTPLQPPPGGRYRITTPMPSMDFDRNLEEARQHAHDPWPLKLLWFYSRVHNKAPWDYKQHGERYRDFGNLHYGAIGAAADIPDWLLLRAAGAAQKKAGTSRPEFGSPLGDPPYGDDPLDQDWIAQGAAFGRGLK